MNLAHMPLLVDRQEAARALRCSPAVVDRLVAAGRLPTVYLDADDDTPKFRPEALVDLLADLVEATAGRGTLTAIAGTGE
jgi:hypothetical protein